MDAQPYDASPEQGRLARPLERAYNRWRLIRDLASQESTQAQLAEKYGVSEVSISAFKRRHATEIEDIARDLENEFAALWIASKGIRLAVLQEDIEETSDSFEPDMMKVRHAALHQAAKELGQVPSAAGVQVQTQSATFSINGVDLEQLR